jgi:hypothetical protein
VVASSGDGERRGHGRRALSTLRARHDDRAHCSASISV